MKLSNYLFFTTQCEPVLNFYTQCGLGSVVAILRHGENGMPVRTESMRGKIMHAQFEGPGVTFFASDNDDAEPMRGSAMMFMLEERSQTERFFPPSQRAEKSPLLWRCSRGATTTAG